MFKIATFLLYLIKLEKAPDSMTLLTQLFVVFRLLTWRPAGTEGDHVTQLDSDKQLVCK